MKKNMIVAGKESFSEVDIVQKVESNVIRFKQLTPNWEVFAEQTSPAWMHSVYRYIDAKRSNLGLSIPPALSDGEFRFVLVRAEPGKGSPLHNHSGQEFMFAMTSSWQIFYGENAQHQIILEPLDGLLVPPGVWRGYRNVGDTLGCFLNITGATDQMQKGLMTM